MPVHRTASGHLDRALHLQSHPLRSPSVSTVRCHSSGQISSQSIGCRMYALFAQPVVGTDLTMLQQSSLLHPPLANNVEAGAFDSWRRLLC